MASAIQDGSLGEQAGNHPPASFDNTIARDIHHGVVYTREAELSVLPDSTAAYGKPGMSPEGFQAVFDLPGHFFRKRTVFQTSLQFRAGSAEVRVGPR